MTKNKLSELSDQELLAEAKKNKSTNIINAFIIGFLIAVVAYSIIVNSFGFLMLIPLFIIYKILNKPKNDKELEKLLKERNLK